MERKTTVYLAGKMTGLSQEEICGWRIAARNFLMSQGFGVQDPTLKEIDIPNRTIVANNKYRIQNGDIILAELDHEEISLGTNAEIVYAGAIGKPVIAWGTNTKVINSPWISEHITQQFSTLQDALCHIATNWKL